MAERSPKENATHAQRDALPVWCSHTEQGIAIRLKVVPRASRSEIVGVLGDRLKVRVASPPAEGQANAAVVKLLEAWSGWRYVELQAGASSPEKTVLLRGCTSLPEKCTLAGDR